MTLIQNMPQQGGTPQNNVGYTRPEVVSLLPRWTLIRDALSGDKAVKDAGEVYLPVPNPTDKSPENHARYESYKRRAIYYNVTARTLKGLTGQVFARDPVLELPDVLSVMEDDVDGGGLSLDQQSRKALSIVLAMGRAGILVDYPKTDGAPTTVAALQSGDIRPNICLYEPWDIINWRVATVGGKKLLTLVVISERMIIDDDGYEAKQDNYYRVLRLVNSAYQSEIWYWSQDNNAFVLDEITNPTDASGKPWTEIPFTFIGSENNDPVPDLPPMYDMAILNMGHYRNSADYEEACFICGQPTPYFTGLTEAWVTTVLKGEIQLGSRAAIPLPENATAGLLQAMENTMPMEAMVHKETQMVALGAKLVEQQQVQRTATEAGMDAAAETSLLATSAKNVSEAYTAALKWASQFVGELVDDLSYELNTDFDISRLSSLDLTALVATWQANGITFAEMRDNLKRGGIAYLPDDEAQAEMETAGLSLGVPVGSPASAAADAADAAATAQAAALKAKTGPAGTPPKAAPNANPKNKKNAKAKAGAY